MMAYKKFKNIIVFFRQGDFMTKLVGISTIIYVLSCFLPAMTTRNEVLFGLGCLVGGGMSILAGDLVQLAIWSANIFYIFGVLSYWKVVKLKSSIFSIIALALGLCMLAHPYVTYDTRVDIKHFDIGYYLWILSFLILFISNLLNRIIGRNKTDR